MDGEYIDESELQKRKRKFIKIFVLIFGVCVLLSWIFVTEQFKPPKDNPEQVQFIVDPGLSVRDITVKAKQENIVRSELLLYILLTYPHDPTNIYAGTYIFSNTDSVFDVAEKLAASETEDDLLRLTIPEGVTVATMASIAEAILPAFDADEYLSLTTDDEGYLFPETYFVPETFTAEDVIELQKKTYEEIILPLRPQIEASGFTEYEVLTLASILEREANNDASMKMVSGILQNRLEIGMALQADATIEYALGTPLHEISSEQLATELRTKESPYNTYLYPGLTPTPIGNPGLMAIMAVLEPTPSDYFYYITDTEGEFHYAKTLAEHNQNVARYLR